VHELEDTVRKLTGKESELREARRVLITDRRKVDGEVADLRKQLKSVTLVADAAEGRAEKLRASLEMQEEVASERLEVARMSHQRAAEELRATVRAEILSQQKEHAAMMAKLLESRRGLEADLETLHEVHTTHGIST
jgi:hypothetical protein